MASPVRVGKRISLEEFLRLPEIDEHPYLEYIDGRIEAKVAPQKKHSLLGKRLMMDIDAYSKPRNLGETFPELRCTFAGRSIIPDIVFLHEDHIETDDNGVVLNPTLRPPDLHIEIVSPDQSARKCRERIVFSRAHGCRLGWLIDPERLTVQVYRPGRRPQRLPDDGVLEGDPVLPGYRLPVAEQFEWLKVRKSKPSPPSQFPDQGEPSR
jgi:Uma2 family endonuclease